MHGSSSLIVYMKQAKCDSNSTLVRTIDVVRDIRLDLILTINMDDTRTTLTQQFGGAGQPSDDTPASYAKRVRGSDGVFAPRMNSNERKAQVWCFPCPRLEGRPDFCVFRMEANRQLVTAKISLTHKLFANNSEINTRY